MDRVAAASELMARREARKSLIPFCRYTFPSYAVNWHHDLIAQYLERVSAGDLDRLMIFTPPRHGKSEEVTVRFNSFYLGNHPDHSVIGCSYADVLARTFSRAAKNTVTGPLYQRLWSVKLAYDADTMWQIAGREDNRPSYIAAGAGGPISGQGAHLLNIDDPVKNAEEADSEVVRESLWNWYTSTARTRLMKRGRIVFTMTRWHEDDLAGRLIELALKDPKADQWTIIVLPATNDNGDEAFVWNTADGVRVDKDGLKKPRKPMYFDPYEALWPEVYGRDELDRIRASSTPRWWNALYQQRPTAMEGGIVKREWIVRYAQKDLPNKWDRLTQSWDMAFKDTKSSSYVAGQVWGRWRTKRYLLDQRREHAGFAKSCVMIRELSEAWPGALVKLVEDKANGPAIMDVLRDDLGGFVPIEPQGSKPARLEAASVQYMTRGVLHPLPEECSWITGVEHELFTAPNCSTWDQADCVSQYLNWEKMESVAPIQITASQRRQQHAYLGAY